LFESGNIVPVDLDAPTIQGFSINELSEKWKQVMSDYSSLAIPNLQLPKFDYGNVSHENNVTISIGDIHLHEVQNVDSFAKQKSLHECMQEYKRNSDKARVSLQKAGKQNRDRRIHCKDREAR
jgi:hypothetical protein